MNGHKFTWFRLNGQAKSQIDRILCSREWLDTWQGSMQEVLHRDVLDHCPLLLKNNNYDWGPKPFRTLNCWFQDESFHDVVKMARSNHQVSSHSAFILKEKLKATKQTLKK